MTESEQMGTPDVLSFDEFVDLLRQRLFDADAIKPGDLHSFKELTKDYANVIPDGWYWDAFAELDAQRHLHDQSRLGNGGDAFARLSADGRLHIRLSED